jgi:hypothetical protein
MRTPRFNEAVWAMFLAECEMIEAIERSNRLLAWKESRATPESLYRKQGNAYTLLEP